MTPIRINPRRALLMGVPLLAALALGLWFALDSSHQVGRGGIQEGVLELDVKSKYSRIKVSRERNERTLWFVRDNGDEVIESMLNLEKPHDLLVNYTKFMFLSYLYRSAPQKVVIVGLGGGSMVHFLKHYDPKVKVDVVEIDPEIVRIADKYFGVRSGGNVNIMTKDAFEYLKNTDSRYDVIYMDAFLKPSDQTDTTGVPLRLKTIKFYKELQTKLTPDGVVVFNMNPHDTIEDDIKNIRDAFAQTYVFELPRGGGFATVGSTAQKRLAPATMRTLAAELDQRFKTSFSFRHMVQQLRR